MSTSWLCLIVSNSLPFLSLLQSWTHNISKEKEFLRKLVKANIITDLTNGIWTSQGGCLSRRTRDVLGAAEPDNTEERDFRGGSDGSVKMHTCLLNRQASSERDVEGFLNVSGEIPWWSVGGWKISDFEVTATNSAWGTSRNSNWLCQMYLYRRRRPLLSCLNVLTV